MVVQGHCGGVGTYCGVGHCCAAACMSLICFVGRECIIKRNFYWVFSYTCCILYGYESEQYEQKHVFLLRVEVT